jgi:hypothetical protein
MPAHHFFVQPILITNFFIQVWRMVQNPTFDTGWMALLSFTLVVFAFTSRVMALTAQNRVIRLEERMRLARLMPSEDHARINDLAMRHLVGLRFADDSEVVDLARRCLNGELQTANDVKKSVKQWRPDFLRV